MLDIQFSMAISIVHLHKLRFTYHLLHKGTATQDSDTSVQCYGELFWLLQDDGKCNHLLPHNVIYCPIMYGRAGFFHLYDNQGYGQIKVFMKLWRSPNFQAEKLQQVTVSWAQHRVVTSMAILQDVTSKWPHFRAKWPKSLQQYLYNIGGQIQLKNPFKPQLLHQNDMFLMDVALLSNKYKPASLKQINYCHLYLNVTLLSDITCPNGSHLDKAPYDGNLPKLSLGSTGYCCVKETKPNDKV